MYTKQKYIITWYKTLILICGKIYIPQVALFYFLQDLRVLTSLVSLIGILFLETIGFNLNDHTLHTAEHLHSKFRQLMKILLTLENNKKRVNFFRLISFWNNCELWDSSCSLENNNSQILELQSVHKFQSN